MQLLCPAARLRPSVTGFPLLLISPASPLRVHLPRSIRVRPQIAGRGLVRKRHKGADSLIEPLEVQLPLGREQEASAQVVVLVGQLIVSEVICDVGLPFLILSQEVLTSVAAHMLLEGFLVLTALEVSRIAPLSANPAPP